MVTTNRPHKILVVDDEEDLRAVIKDEFELSGWTVFQAESGNKALVNYKQNPVEAIVSDIRMQDGNGIELLKKIKSLGSKGPLFFLITGYSDFTTDEVFHLGADGIFNKPFDLDQVIETVNSHLKGRNSLWMGAPESKCKFIVTQNFDNLSCYLGKGGIFIPSTHSSCRVGDAVDLNLKSSAGEIESISGQGIVRWTRSGGSEPGYGVEFKYLKDDSIQQICRFLETKQPTYYIPNKKVII